MIYKLFLTNSGTMFTSSDMSVHIILIIIENAFSFENLPSIFQGSENPITIIHIEKICTPYFCTSSA